jgi:hypothetical protein
MDSKKRSRSPTSTSIDDLEKETNQEGPQKKLKTLNPNISIIQKDIALEDQQRIHQWTTWLNQLISTISQYLSVRELIPIIIHEYLNLPSMRVLLPLRPLEYFNFRNWVHTTIAIYSQSFTYSSATSMDSKSTKTNLRKQTAYIRPIYILGKRQTNISIQWLCAAVRVGSISIKDPFARTGRIPEFMYSIDSPFELDLSQDETIPDEKSYLKEVSHQVQMMVISATIVDSLLEFNILEGISTNDNEWTFDCEEVNQNIFRLPSLSRAYLYDDPTEDKNLYIHRESIDHKISWTPEQETIFKASLIPGSKIWIHGPAGSGKSSIADRVSQWFVHLHKTSGLPTTSHPTHVELQFLLRHESCRDVRFVIMYELHLTREDPQFLQCLCGFQDDKTVELLPRKFQSSILIYPICLLRSHLNVVICSRDPPPPFAPDLQVQVFELSGSFS